MKHLWCDLLREEYIHVDTFKRIAEEQPQLLKEFVEWSGEDRATIRKLHCSGVVTTKLWEMFLTREPFSMTVFFKLLDAKAKMICMEHVQELTASLIEDSNKKDSTK